MANIKNANELLEALEQAVELISTLINIANSGGLITESENRFFDEDAELLNARKAIAKAKAGA